MKLPRSEPNKLNTLKEYCHPLLLDYLEQEHNGVERLAFQNENLTALVPYSGQFGRLKCWW